MESTTGAISVTFADVSALLAKHMKGYTIKNLYVFGSRLYGCAKPDSDWDFFAIVDGDYFFASKLFETEVIQLNVFHKDYFVDLLHENYINEVMVIYTPKEFVWKEDIKFDFKLRIPALQKSVRMDSTHNYAKAKRLWKSDIYVARKNLVHGIRYLRYCLQLLESGAITDFSAGNEAWAEIMNNPSVDWKDYEAKYEPLYNELTARLKSYQAPIDDMEDVDGLKCISYLKKKGLESLITDFSVVVRRDSKYPNLIHLTHDGSSVMDSTIVQECSGIVVDESQGYKVLAMPYHKMFSTTSELHAIPKLDFESLTLTEMLDGRMVCLYWYNAEWRTATKNTADGSEIETVNFMKFSDWKNYVEMNVEHFSTLHPNKGSLIWMAGSNVSDPPVVDVFWRIWKELGYTLPDDITKCYIFEMLNPERTNIVEHEKVGIILTGVRDLETLQEEEAENFAQKYNWKCVPVINLPCGTKVTIDSATELAAKLDPMKCAGFVLRDCGFRRVQVRSPQFYYLEKMHPLNDVNLSKKLLLDIIRTNQIETWIQLEKYSHWKALYTELKVEYEAMLEHLQTVYDDIRSRWDASKRGVFAKEVKGLGYESLMFQLMNDKCPVRLLHSRPNNPPPLAYFSITAPEN